MAKKKDNAVGVTAIKDFLKGTKGEEREVMVASKDSESVLAVIIKTRVTFRELCEAALAAVESIENSAITENDGSPLKKISIRRFLVDYAMVKTFTNIKIDALDVDTAYDLMYYSSLLLEICSVVDNDELNHLAQIIDDTLKARQKEDAWQGLGKKLGTVLDKVNASVEGTDSMDISTLLQKIMQIGNLDESKVVEAVLEHGDNREGHNAAPTGVRTK